MYSLDGSGLHGFNPRSRKGNDDYMALYDIKKKLFQSTFPQGERPTIRGHTNNPGGFNPRSRKGNDCRYTSQKYTQQTFQSTFPQGERQPKYRHDVATVMFQSTFPQGERRAGSEGCREIQAVSIHVPARGTTQGWRIHDLYKRFQSTFPQGERQDEKKKEITNEEFQSTFPQGERLDMSLFGFDFSEVSIHVPARGTTRSCLLEKQK